MPDMQDIIEDRLRRLRKLKKTLPDQIGEEAKNFFQLNWEKQGFHDDAVSPWAPRAKDAPRNAGRALLVDSGDLRASVRVQEASWDRVVVGSDLKYAPWHNYGNPKTNLPQRKFIGPSRTLNRKLADIMNKEIAEAIK